MKGNQYWCKRQRFDELNRIVTEVKQKLRNVDGNYDNDDGGDDKYDEF